MLKLSNLKIDPEFSAQILPLSFEELQQLERIKIIPAKTNPAATLRGSGLQTRPAPARVMCSVPKST